MKIPTRRRRYGLKFDLTPMNDIVFLLIIFLVASPHFTSSDAEDKVELTKIPEEKSDTSQTERRLEITVNRDGEFRIGNTPATLEAIRNRIAAEGQQLTETKAGFEVRLRVDKHTRYAVIEPILAACARAGITDVKYAVRPE